jgi:hypothetical protein
MKYQRISWETGWSGLERYSGCLHPCVDQTSEQKLKDDVNGFSCTSNIYFMVVTNSELHRGFNLQIIFCNSWVKKLLHPVSATHMTYFCILNTYF